MMWNDLEQLTFPGVGSIKFDLLTSWVSFMYHFILLFIDSATSVHVKFYEGTILHWHKRGERRALIGLTTITTPTTNQSELEAPKYVNTVRVHSLTTTRRLRQRCCRVTEKPLQAVSTVWNASTSCLRSGRGRPFLTLSMSKQHIARVTTNWCLCRISSASFKRFKCLLQKSTKWIFSWFLGLKDASSESACSDVSCQTRSSVSFGDWGQRIGHDLCSTFTSPTETNRLRTCCRSTAAGQQRHPRDTDTGSESPEGELGAAKAIVTSCLWLADFQITVLTLKFHHRCPNFSY